MQQNQYGENGGSYLLRGRGTRCGFGPAGAEPPENPQFLQSLQDLVIFSGREGKKKFCSEAFKGVDL